MILLDQPYVSDFLQRSLCQYNIPVIDTAAMRALNLDKNLPIISEEQAIAKLTTDPSSRLYSNSENALSWISQNLASTHWPEQINTFKDKVAFRKLLQPLYPQLFFCEIPVAKLGDVDIKDWPWPVIVKPSVGFFSMGVHKVSSAAEWQNTVTEIHAEIEQAADLYPTQVIDTAAFIVEGFLAGEEYAIDAYFDSDGQPVILDVLHHMFSSSSDVSDRIYLTSADIVLSYHEQLAQLLTTIGELKQLRNFPVHLEVRIDASGSITPIELNPMRFAGWCTTDIAYHAYGIDPYDYFFHNKQPDWQQIYQETGSRITSLIILDRPETIAVERIAGFDYDRLQAQMSQPVELRKVDFHHYPLFGILFTHTQPELFAEISAILKANMAEYVQLKG
jgi:hypothetical protein